MKLFGKGDLKVLRLRHSSSTHYFITPQEMRRVIELTDDSGYVLYSYYRTGFFTEAEQFEDIKVGDALGWGIRKVQKQRLALESKGLFKVVRFGTKTEGITKVLVGEDTIALDNAGLPADILDSKAFNKLKRKFKIDSTQELIECAHVMAREYLENPNEYK